MIFVCCGTQMYQFDRLLIQLDILVENGIINEEIFAQIGTSNYIPKHYKFEKFISHDKFDELRRKASIIISHGGTGALIGASKLGKNIIAVPRLAKFGEHIDDHQLQIVDFLDKQGYIRSVVDIEKLGETIIEATNKPITKKYDRESNVLNIIISYIEKLDNEEI
ncbi:MAG TPA: beta(1,3)galactosyltransferase EpsH [Erysipelotrichaceae bacterium]|nr:beta(1,3)galactosyltransferase EpsH [Erysipelotrichaceae bacterium]